MNDPSIPGAHCEQQVFYQSGQEDPLPGNMEDINISIVNEQTTGSKRERDDATAVTPCAKKSGYARFSCSTPSTAATHIWAFQHSDFPDWHPRRQNSQQEELDDSLLDLSDDEDDSELFLTRDEEDALLKEDDDGDPCYAAEPSGKLEMTICVSFTPSLSENEGENGGASPSKTLNTSDTLTEEPESEGNISNYAAMPPSPCQSAIGPVEGIIPKQSSVCNDYVESAPITTKGNGYIISDSTLPPHNIESDEVLTAKAKFFSTSDAAQYVPPPSFDTAGLPNVQHPNPGELEPSTTSSIVTSEPKPSMESPGTEQNVECQKPSEAEEAKGMLNVESTSRPTHPSESAAPGTNGNQSKVVVSDCKAQCSLDPEKEKPLIAVAPLPRTSFRAFLPDFELERDKNIYCDQVLMHLNAQGPCNLQDSLNELASLMIQNNRENQNWQHPSNFTKRNHPRIGKKPSERCTLKQWVAKNGGHNERFKNFPDTFQRSPIPDALPFSY